MVCYKEAERTTALIRLPVSSLTLNINFCSYGASYSTKYTNNYLIKP